MGLGLSFVEKWSPFSVFGLLFLGVFPGGKNISINSVRWNWVVLWIFIFWCWLVWSGGLGEASEGSALWGRLLVNFVINLNVLD